MRSFTTFKGDVLTTVTCLVDSTSSLGRTKCDLSVLSDLQKGANTLVIIFVSYHDEQLSPFSKYLSLITITWKPGSEVERFYVELFMGRQ